jgi:integrating conjugative element protein (TIGR03759 family)
MLNTNKTDHEALARLAWQPADRVLFFTDTQCPTCDAVLERLVSQLAQFSGIDVYLINVSPGEESLIREWAASKQISPQWVKEHKVTLNVDAGARDRVAAHTGQDGQALPVLVLRRGDQFTPLPAWRF